MRNDYTLPELQQKVKKESRNFNQSVVSWLGVCTFLFLLNAFTSFGHWWAIYPFLGWGLGIFFQATKLAQLRRDEKELMEEQSPSQIPMQNKKEEGFLDLNNPAPKADATAQDAPIYWNKKDFV